MKDSTRCITLYSLVALQTTRIRRRWQSHLRKKAPLSSSPLPHQGRLGACAHITFLVTRKRHQVQPSIQNRFIRFGILLDFLVDSRFKLCKERRIVILALEHIIYVLFRWWLWLTAMLAVRRIQAFPGEGRCQTHLGRLTDESFPCYFLRI